MQEAEHGPKKLKLAASFKYPKRTERKDDKMLYSTEENCRMESGLSWMLCLSNHTEVANPITASIQTQCWNKYSNKTMTTEGDSF